jgi:hypothetical protein
MNRARYRALRAMIYAQWVYWIMWAVCIWAQNFLPTGPWRVALTLVPIPPGILVIAVCIWQFQASDEYLRSKMMTAASLVAVVTAIWTLAYTYLEMIGFPKLSMMWVGNIGWLIFVGMMVRVMVSGREESTT